MEIKIIELYCFICQIYDNNPVLKEQRLSNFKPRFSDQELVTCYFLAMLNNHTQIREIYDYTRNHWRAWFPALPSYQAFNCRLNNLSADFAVISDRLLRARLSAVRGELTEDTLIDSFPVMLARGSKARKCRTASDLADFGYCASKDVYYHGVKLHHLAIRRIKRLPVSAAVFLTPAATHDLTAFKQQNVPIPTRNLFADKAYADSEVKQSLAAQGVTLLTPYKPKKNEPPQFNEPLWSKFVSRFRQPIEGFFNWLDEKTDYQNASKVRSSKGLLVHCYGKLAFVGLLLCFYS